MGERFGTAGQPAAEQFELIKADGYQAVVNLARPDSTDALPEERTLVTGLGLAYAHIPVDFGAPTQQDLQQFFAVLDRHEGKRVFVHCAANKRVSAFMFLYRVKKLRVPVPEAEMALHRIWVPDAVWQDFIDRMLRA
ncbi:MAG TPA: protein tyrosine phosphatase family protein [Candidatus Binatia bacterium]|nr:protein tyrosine phosphatase family protein [Candidatus Binatia bacterium]